MRAVSRGYAQDYPAKTAERRVVSRTGLSESWAMWTRRRPVLRIRFDVVVVLMRLGLDFTAVLACGLPTFGRAICHSDNDTGDIR